MRIVRPIYCVTHENGDVSVINNATPQILKQMRELGNDIVEYIPRPSLYVYELGDDSPAVILSNRHGDDPEFENNQIEIAEMQGRPKRTSSALTQILTNLFQTVGIKVEYE